MKIYTVIVNNDGGTWDMPFTSDAKRLEFIRGFFPRTIESSGLNIGDISYKGYLCKKDMEEVRKLTSRCKTSQSYLEKLEYLNDKFLIFCDEEVTLSEGFLNNEPEDESPLILILNVYPLDEEEKQAMEIIKSTVSPDYLDMQLAENLYSCEMAFMFIPGTFGDIPELKCIDAILKRIDKECRNTNSSYFRFITNY